MGIRILIAALLSFALIQFSPDRAFNNPEANAVAVASSEANSTAGQRNKQGLLTAQFNEQVSKIQAATPAEGNGAKQEKQELQPVAVTPPPVKAEKPKLPKKQGCETYRPLLEQYNWDVRTALAVMQAESGCNPTALSPTRDRGLMQINAVHAAKVNGNLEVLYDPATNIRVAYSVYLSQGWNAWSAYKNGKHLKFL